MLLFAQLSRVFGVVGSMMIHIRRHQFLCDLKVSQWKELVVHDVESVAESGGNHVCIG